MDRLRLTGQKNLFSAIIDSIKENDYMKLDIPDHQNTIYFEKYSLCVLQDFSPDKYQRLILSDKPDLHDINGIYGVEVSMVDSINELKTADLYDKYVLEVDENRRINLEEKIRNHGASILSYGSEVIGLSYDVQLVDCTNIISCVHNKVEKLNKYNAGARLYKEFPHYELFISLTSHDEPRQDIRKLINEIHQIQESYAYKYDTIYLFTQFGNLFILDMNKKDLIIKDITNEQYAAYKSDAMNYVNSL